MVGNSPAVIKPKTTDNAYTSPGQGKLNTASIQTPNQNPILPHSRSELSNLPSVSIVDAEGVEFEGESSLHAHSIAARDLLVQTLGHHSHLRDNPKMVVALNSLRQIVEADKVEPLQKKPKLLGLGAPKQSIYELKLPPAEIVLDILRKSKERSIFTFSPPLAYVTRDQFNDLCKTVFFRTEDYPTSTAIIVHSSLESLFQEFKWSEKDPALRQQYDEWAQLCRINIEISISNLDLLLPATLQSVQALLLAAQYCMEIAQASLCRKIVVHGCMMVQTLGWHRSSSMKNDSESMRQQKGLIFWMLYIIDKSLSLRLGQASLIQDYDIDLPFPRENQSSSFASLSRIGLWANSARVMGLVYQQLYSPGALKQTDAARFQSVQQLLQEVQTIRPKPSEKDDISLLVQNLDFAPSDYMYDASELLFKSDEITYYALLCIVYRATPASAKSDYDPAVECVKYARAALDCHRKCTAEFKHKTEMWAMYLHWTILNTPFVPFTTLFSHVLTTRDRSDLERLQDFAESMSDCPTSHSAYKVSRLASVFVNVATVYIESREQEVVEPQRTTSPTAPNYTSTDIYQQTTANPMPAWAPMDTFLHALGFAEDPSLNVDGAAGTNANLENWFNGNQHIMGLLEDDLSYLDPAALNFQGM
ncbi:MAG: hypothetical protein M1821_006674 [Bathelium mastoideum]|nr:MAG: hypothetical protein M1821_006674 [Bathelium mastoideum]